MCALQFGSVVQGGAWTPHVVISEESNLVHASRFRDQEAGQTVWLIVNRWRGERVNLSFVSFSSFLLLSRDPEHAVEAGLRLECEGATGVLVDVYHGLVLDRWLSVGCSYHM